MFVNIIVNKLFKLGQFCNVFKWAPRGHKDLRTILRFDVRKVLKCVHLSLGIAVHLLLLLQLDGGIEEVLNCHIIGTLLKSFGVVELEATRRRVIELWIVMWEGTG